MLGGELPVGGGQRQPSIVSKRVVIAWEGTPADRRPARDAQTLGQYSGPPARDVQAPWQMSPRTGGRQAGSTALPSPLK